MPFLGVRLERVAIVLEAPDDKREFVDHGRSVPTQHPQLTIKGKRIDRFGLRRRPCGEGIEVRLERGGITIRRPSGIATLRRSGRSCRRYVPTPLCWRRT